MRHNQLLETAKDGETLLMLSSPQGAKRIRKKRFPLKAEFNQVDLTVAALWNLSVLLVCMHTLFIYVYYIYLYLISSSPPALNHLCSGSLREDKRPEAVCDTQQEQPLRGFILTDGTWTPHRYERVCEAAV